MVDVNMKSILRFKTQIFKIIMDDRKYKVNAYGYQTSFKTKILTKN